MEGIMIVKGTLSYKEERIKTRKRKAKRTLPETGSKRKARTEWEEEAKKKKSLERK